ncbi:hypothetical protein FH972_024761 [Carpinus fangiana]|uniref:Uncharacterized protein n=1 Tax=Carpinus fangiana TaxID=176857 RepID=A0A5N6KZB5_9ROSI|nr:hypothetical protein FH972_024761 [Carpinus fangiana]
MKVGVVVDDEKEPSASDALPLPLYLTNAVFFTLFFSKLYLLLMRWHEKIRNSNPLHVVALVALVTSFIYLLGFFGIDFVQSIFRPSAYVWAAEYDKNDNKEVIIEEDVRKVPCSFDCAPPTPQVVETLASEDDEEIIKAVVARTTPSYSLETRLGDCKRAAVIRREVVQRVTGKSLARLPLEGFDYQSILVSMIGDREVGDDE